DLWLKTHIEKLLGPLFDLQKAEDVTGIARGIAFQLIEALGVIERAKIAAEMKDLDQASRASLRKYGVRFGAYHIYLPALLKPAGAFDGRGFVVTQAMSSLTGSAGEDFASILRALGYRMEKRAPLPPKPVVAEAAVVEAAALETPVEAGSGGLTDDGADVAPE